MKTPHWIAISNKTAKKRRRHLVSMPVPWHRMTFVSHVRAGAVSQRKIAGICHGLALWAGMLRPTRAAQRARLAAALVGLTTSQTARQTMAPPTTKPSVMVSPSIR